MYGKFVLAKAMAWCCSPTRHCPAYSGKIDDAIYLNQMKMSWCTPLFKSNRNLFSSVKWWYLFSMYRFEFFYVAWWGLLHSLWKIPWAYVIAALLCEHSNLVRIKKRVAKTLQHGYRYGDILMLYDIITTYEWFFCHKTTRIMFW